MATLKNTTVSGTGAATLPRGTYAQRPSAANGMMRFNSNTGTAEIYTAANTSSATWAASQGHDIVKQNLVLWYDFGDLSSYAQGGATTVTNLARSAHNGSFQNMTPTFNGGNQGYLVFDGQNDHITIGDSVNEFAWTPNGAIGKQNITLEMWVWSTDTDGVFFTKPWNGSGQYNIWLFPGSWYLTNDSGSGQISFARNLSNNTWTHIVAWANSTQMGYYINGGEYSGSINHGMTTGNVPQYGHGVTAALMTLYPYGSGMGSNEGFSIAGNLAIVRYYHSVLSAAQAYQNFTAERHRFGV